jgi:hypothetical protein
LIILVTRFLSTFLILTLAWTSTIQAFFVDVERPTEQITKHLGFQAFQAGIGASLDIAMGQKPSAVLGGLWKNPQKC